MRRNPVAEGMQGGAEVTRPPLWRELAGGLILFAIYSVVARWQWSGRADAAVSHARDIFRLERTLGIDIEHTLNNWLAGRDLLRTIANYEYAFTYIISAALLLVWLYWRHPDHYRWARTSFVALNLFGIATFAAFPVTPPRLMTQFGFIDTVSTSHTWGSWGSPLVDQANQLAAMPSLHLAWALWVSVVLGLIAGSLRTQLVSSIHVLTTLFVIMATANHYLLDAAGGVAVVLLGVAVGGLVERRHRGRVRHRRRIAAADAFFLYVESGAAAQNVGGLIMLDTTGSAGAPRHDELVALVQTHLAHLPRFRQQLEWRSRWYRPRWVEADAIDWDWHVIEQDLAVDGQPDSAPGALAAYVAGLQATLLPRDRPMWRLVSIRGFAPGEAAVVLLVHHVIADGVGTVAQALRLLEPHVPLARPDPSQLPSRVRRFAATVTGVAQLATDGRAQKMHLDTSTGERGLVPVTLPLADVRDVAHAHGCRITDIVLSMLAEGITETAPNGGAGLPERLRVAVTLLVPRPDGTIEGNATGTVMIDLPMGLQPDRLAAIAARTSRLRSGTRAIASRFVMDTVGELLPPVAHRWFARTVYGPRFFHAIVSNLPGPDLQLSLAGRPLIAGYPLLPLAPGTPIALGALGVNGALAFGLTVHPALVPDPERLRDAMLQAFARLRDDADLDGGAGVQASARTSRNRASGSSSTSPSTSRSLPIR